MIFIKRLLGIITGALALLVSLVGVVGGVISGDYKSAGFSFLVAMFLFGLTIYFFDKHLVLIEEAKENAKNIEAEKKLKPKKPSKMGQYPQAQREDLATLWEMGTVALADDCVDLSEARLLYAYMRSRALLDKDNRTKNLFETLKTTLSDNVLDSIEAEEIKTLLSEFVDTRTKIKQVEADARRELIYQQKQKPKPKTTNRKPNNKKFTAVDPSGYYAFDYTDASGNTSFREVSALSVKNQDGRLYLNGICADRNAYRTFRVDRMHNLVATDTGEIIDDAVDHFS